MLAKVVDQECSFHMYLVINYWMHPVEEALTLTPNADALV